MQRLGLILLTLLAGCARPVGSVPPSASQWGDCTMADADSGGRVVVRADLDGDAATREVLKLFAPGEGPCAGGLVLRSGSGVSGIDVAHLGLDPAHVRVAFLRGRPREAVIVAPSRPRGNGAVQTHLFVPTGGGHLAEVEEHGRPLLPLAAPRDGHAVTATCAPTGRVDVWTGTPHQPAGIVLAWDVRRTTYRIDAGRALRDASHLVENGTADPTMRTKMPRLFDPTGALSDC